jgi:hypothetical protein
MAYALEDIRDVHAEEIERPKIPLSAETRAGLEHHYRDGGTNPGRSTFKRISLRDIPDFTRNDHQLRIVVAQTAYSHFRTGKPWERIPEVLTVDPVALTCLIAERLDKYFTTRPDYLSFNTTKDYVACLSAVAYFKWRIGLHHNEIATCLQIHVEVVNRLSVRLRASAFRLGMPVKFSPLPRNGRKRGEVVKEMWQDPEYRALQSTNFKKAWADPEKRARKLAAMRNPEVIEKRRKLQSQTMKEICLKKFLKTVAWG